MLFTVASGLAVANIYYAQPLLTAIAKTFDVASDTASLVVMVGQIGYAVGLALLVPLGDVVDRRRLAMILLLGVAVAEAVSAAAPSLGVLIAAAGVLGLSAVVAPILVPFAATLAAPSERGRVAGKVVSGVLAGVLLARVCGGLVAQVGGWRTVYASAAILMVGLAAMLYWKLPRVTAPAQLRYLALLRSVLQILWQEPVLRLRCAYGVVAFAGFNTLWTSVAFLLARPPYNFSVAEIGLFGLGGWAGALAAGLAGRLADRSLDRPATGAFLIMILASWGFMALNGGRWFVTLVIGVVALDFGIQALNTLNLTVSYRLRPTARSRITTAYMTIYFAGGVLGAATSGTAYAAGGWVAVCLAGAGFAAIGLVLWLAEVLVRLVRRSH